MFQGFYHEKKMKQEEALFLRLSGSNFLLGGGWQLAINDSLNVTYLGIDLIMRFIPS